MDKFEPTHSQYKILKDIDYRITLDKNEITPNHWELVRNGYLTNLVSLQKDWTFKVTEKGFKYLDEQKDG